MSELKEAFIKTYGQVKDLQAVKSPLGICLLVPIQIIKVDV